MIGVFAAALAGTFATIQSFGYLGIFFSILIGLILTVILIDKITIWRKKEKPEVDPEIALPLPIELTAEQLDSLKQEEREKGKTEGLEEAKRLYAPSPIIDIPMPRYDSGAQEELESIRITNEAGREALRELYLPIAQPAFEQAREFLRGLIEDLGGDRRDICRQTVAKLLRRETTEFLFSRERFYEKLNDDLYDYEQLLKEFFGVYKKYREIVKWIHEAGELFDDNIGASPRYIDCRERDIEFVEELRKKLNRRDLQLLRDLISTEGLPEETHFPLSPS